MTRVQTAGINGSCLSMSPGGEEDREPWRLHYVKEVIWGTILAGGHMEFYTGRDDVKYIDYTSYEDRWKAMGHGAAFMNNNLAKEIADMKPNDDLAIGKNNWAMANEGQTYLLYSKEGGEA